MPIFGKYCSKIQQSILRTHKIHLWLSKGCWARGVFIIIAPHLSYVPICFAPLPDQLEFDGVYRRAYAMTPPTTYENCALNSM